MELYTGIRVQLLIGAGVPLPASPDFLEKIQEIEIKHSDEGRSGCKIVFREGRNGPQDLLDYPLVSDPRFAIMSRVVVIVMFGLVPTPIFDGFITEQQLQPGEWLSGTTFTILAEDVSVKMDLEDKRKGHPASFDLTLFAEISATYATTGMVLLPMAGTPGDLRLPTDGVTFQTGTDFEFLTEVAKKNGYVFYVEPGPVPLMNTLYFGPKVQPGLPQCPLNVNMGPASNATGLNFGFDGTQAATVQGKIQDRLTGQQTQVQSVPQPGMPTAAQPAQANPDQVRIQRLKDSAGLTMAEALARATGQAANTTQVLTADGELDTLRYNGILKAHGIAQIRGTGMSYDGLYYVKSVTHSIKVGSYKQKFQLRREGLGSTVPAVIPC